MNYLRGQLVGGFTLLEALLAAVLLAMGIGAITMPFVAGAQNEHTDATRTQAINLAQEMMEVILALPFEDEDPNFARNPGPEPTEFSRYLFDNIDDFHGYSELSTGTAGGFHWNTTGDPIAGDLSRHVTATYVYLSGQDMTEPPSFIRVTVEVRNPRDVPVTLTRLIYDLP